MRQTAAWETAVAPRKSAKEVDASVAKKKDDDAEEGEEEENLTRHFGLRASTFRARVGRSMRLKNVIG